MSGSHRNKANRHKISYKSGRYPNLHFWLSECKNLFIQYNMMAIRIDGKLAILWNDFHCDVKPFMTFITMAPTVALNKSVHLIAHLFTWETASCYPVSYWLSSMEKIIFSLKNPLGVCIIYHSYITMYRYLQKEGNTINAV